MSNYSHREIIEDYVTSLPEGTRFTSTSVSADTGIYPESVSHHFTGLYRSGVIKRIGSERAYKRKRYVYVNATTPKQTPASDRKQLLDLLPIFTTAELVEELKRRSS